MKSRDLFAVIVAAGSLLSGIAVKAQVAIASIAVAILCIASQGAMASSYNVVTGFNDTGTQPQAGNPFIYGTEQTLNGPLTLFPLFGTANCTNGVCTSDGSVKNYYSGTNFVGATTGLANVTNGNTLFFDDGLLVIPNNVLVVEPSNTTLNVTRFTAPVADLYNLTGSFSDLQVSSVGLAILVNGSTVFSASYDGSSNHQATIPFSINIALTQGMILDFVISSLGDQDFDIIGLQAQILGSSVAPPSETPLPATLPLFLTGLGTLGLMRWRRKKGVQHA